MCKLPQDEVLITPEEVMGKVNEFQVESKDDLRPNSCAATYSCRV